MKEGVNFSDLGLSDNTLKAIEKKGFKTTSEIQARIIPLVLENKNDIIGISQTGSGKTGSFGLPIIDLIDEGNKTPKVLILAPTRELALQVTSELSTFKGNKKLKILTVYGGTSIGNQIKDLKRGIDIVVGTPGRVLDLVERRSLNLSQVDHFVLDEADEMLRMGFIEDIELIFESTSKDRKVLLFSATMPEKIKKLSKKYMKNQIIVEVKSKVETKLNIKQEYFVLKVSDKFPTLCNIIDIEDFFYGIIFCMTKADVDDITKKLKRAGYDADCIHGDIAQVKREKILKKFRDLKINILVATDVAARGIDVNDLTHVINYALPKETENYIHRIGRTGRAGKSGTAISFVTPKQKFMLREIEKLTKLKIEPGKLPNQKEISEKKILNQKNEILDIVKGNTNNEYNDLSKTLIEEFGAEKVVSSLLSKINTKIIEKVSNDRNDSYSNNDDCDVRLFIARGRNDRIRSKKDLFTFLEKEARISIDGESVKINDKFSFVNVPEDQAKKILDSFSRKRKGIVERAMGR